MLAFASGLSLSHGCFLISRFVFVVELMVCVCVCVKEKPVTDICNELCGLCYELQRPVMSAACLCCEEDLQHAQGVQQLVVSGEICFAWFALIECTQRSGYSLLYLSPTLRLCWG